MTSVGYGDIAPTTWFGKLVGSGERRPIKGFDCKRANVWMLQLAPSAECSVSHSRFQLSWIISTNSMKKLKLRRRYWQKRSGPRGRRQSEVCVIDENDIIKLYTQYCVMLFQEFSKTSMIHLTRLILKPWTMFTERVHSRPVTSQVSEPLTTICHLDPRQDKKYSDYHVLPGASFWEKDSPWPVTSSTLAETVSGNNCPSLTI